MVYEESKISGIYKPCLLLCTLQTNIPLHQKSFSHCKTFFLYTISSILYSSVLWRRSINHEKSTPPPPPPPLYLSNVSTQNGTGLFSMRYSSTASNVRSPSELVSVMLESTLSQLNVLNWQWFTQLKEDSNQYV